MPSTKNFASEVNKRPQKKEKGNSIQILENNSIEIVIQKV